MSEVTQPEATPANQPAGGETTGESSAAGESQSTGQSTQANSSESFLTVKYNKKQAGLSRDEAKSYAQKGMNYDKVFGRLKEANAKLREYESRPEKRTGQTESAERQAKVNGQLSDFIKSHPGVDPRSLPADVLQAWKKGTPLKEAAAAYQAKKYHSEIDSLKKQIMQLKTNECNAEASMGRPASFGSAQQKPLTAEAIKKMSRKEIDKNIDRIWEFLTGVKRNK